MSEPYVEFVRDLYDRFNAGQRESLISLAHPDFEVRSLMAAVQATEYRGRDGLREYLREMDAAWGHFQLRGERFEAVPTGVLVVGGVDLRASASGVALEVPITWLWTFSDGLIRRLVAFDDPDEAARAAREP